MQENLSTPRNYSYSRTLLTHVKLKKVIVTGASHLCRKDLWRWVFTRVEPKRSRLKNEIGEKLAQQLNQAKLAGRSVKLVRMRGSNAMRVR